MAAYLGAGFTPSQLSLLESRRLRPSAAQQARLDQVFGPAAAGILEPVQALDPTQLVEGR